MLKDDIPSDAPPALRCVPPRPLESSRGSIASSYPAGHPMCNSDRLVFGDCLQFRTQAASPSLKPVNRGSPGLNSHPRSRAASGRGRRGGSQDLANGASIALGKRRSDLPLPRESGAVRGWACGRCNKKRPTCPSNFTQSRANLPARAGGESLEPLPAESTNEPPRCSASISDFDPRPFSNGVCKRVFP